MTELLHPEEIITSFLLIRHGHTRATEAGLLYTDPDAPLTDSGLEQAQCLASWLPSQKPEVLLTSPSFRVRSTAELLSQSTGLSANVVVGLDEWRVGDWEGRAYVDIKKAEPELYSKWAIDPINNAPPGGESIIQLCERGKSFLQTLIENNQGKKIALVTHAGIIRSILVNALEMPIQNFWRLVIPTGSVSKVDFSENFASVHFTGLRPNAMK